MSSRSKKIADRWQDFGYRPNSKAAPSRCSSFSIPIGERPTLWSSALRTFAEIDARREDGRCRDIGLAGRRRRRAACARGWRTPAIFAPSATPFAPTLGRWLPLFRSPEGNGSRGTNMLAGLIQVEAGLSALNASHHQPGISEKLIAIRSDELRKLGALAKAVLSPVRGLGHINPMRWIRKRNLRKLMTAMDLRRTMRAFWRSTMRSTWRWACGR